jgi:basic membrane lipoprotein Med (substrate-binding protein (PBP1-ABC) superfamily)
MSGRFEYVDEPAQGRYEFIDEKAPTPSFKERMLARETNDLSKSIRRGLRDIVDTGAEGLAWGYDKLTGGNQHTLSSLITGERPIGEYGRVKAMNDAGKAEWEQGTGGELLPHVQRFGGNILGTGTILGGAGRIVGNVGLPGLGNAIGSAGMTTGRTLSPALDMGTRIAGGAINGYATAGLIDPESATTGGVLGAITPPVLQGVHAAFRAGAKAVRNLKTPADVTLAGQVAHLGGAQGVDDIARMRDVLRQGGPSILPGSQATVPQILQLPEVSQLQRSIRAAAPTAFAEREAAQNAARVAALNRVAPVSGTVQQAAEDAGTAISGFAIPAEAAARRNVSSLFDAIPPEQATMHLPIEQMQAAQSRYLGPGTFGKGAATAEQAIASATDIGVDAATSAPRVVPFDQIQALRSSIGEAIADAQKNGRNQAAAALTQMKNAIDNKVAEVASGVRQPGEVFTPEAVDAWGQALQAHSAKKLRFNTGPQTGMFRQGADGQPAIQGAEIPGKFFGSSRSQVENAQAFRRLVADDPRLMDDLRRYAITDAAGQTDRFGNLTNAKFNRWLDARSGATGEIFTEQQRAILKAVAEDLRRADVAENLGRSTGSDTAQKIANMTRLGLLDSPGLGFLAGRIPGGQTALGLLQGPARNAQAERIGGLLLDPERTAGLLDVFIATKKPIPRGLLAPAMDPLMYRGAPLLSNQGGGGG